jgi:hypothetical protein
LSVAFSSVERPVPRRGRAEIAEHVGPIRVRATPEEILLEAQKGHVGSVVLAATGQTAHVK